MKSAPTIAFDYRPSRRVAAALALIALLACLAPWCSAWPWYASLLLSLLTLALAAHAAHGLLHPRFVRVAHRADGWILCDTQGNEQAALLCSHRHLGPLLTLDWRWAPRRRFRIALTPDNLDADTRRRLIVLLRRLATTDGGSTLPR